MTAAKRFEVRAGEYYDSAVLMQLQRALAALPGIIDAGVVMGTPANLELLQDAGMAPDPGVQIRPEDLLLAVLAEDEPAAEAALSQVDDLLARRPAAPAGTYRPRSLSSAARLLPSAGWVLISIPGRYAADVASQAVELGRHVFLYSDNVPLQDEVRLKVKASQRGTLVMGPDCGTALINGVGFGFANRVRRGPVGLVSASGTGLQAVSVRIHQLGSGISHAIGTGGRDLSEEVGGITTLQGLELLARDPETRAIVLVSKPPDVRVVGRLISAAGQIGKPVIAYFLGHAPPGRRLNGITFAVSLEDAAELAIEAAGEPERTSSEKTHPPAGQRAGALRGLFSGGTLAAETLGHLGGALDPLYSNIPLYAHQALPQAGSGDAHLILDLGADEFTVGRLHPMMDNDLRLRRLRQEAADPGVGLILLDVVLGEGAHPDPAAELAPAIEEACRRGGLEVVVLVLGTDEDPQEMHEQSARLEAAGARVYHRLSEALEYVRGQFPGSDAAGPPPVDLPALQAPVAAINVGLESFYASLVDQGAEAVQVDWRPPAAGDESLMSILQKMKGGSG